jgi:D-glycero-alpha-D-manno-heptose 1-phosphate guanylyltransferase
MNKKSGYTVVVLAGGLGTRLKEIVNDVPKPMAPIRGKPFLEYLLSYWISNGASRFILSVGYRNQKIKDYFGTVYHGVPINYVIEDEPLGTGGALLRVLDKEDIKEEFFLVNGDTLFQIDVSRMLELHDGNKADMTLSLRTIENADRYHTISINDADKIISIDLLDKSIVCGNINGGLYIISPELFHSWTNAGNKNISLENEILPGLIKNHSVYGYIDDGDFIDIGIPEDYQRAQSCLNDELLSGTGVK